MLKLRIGDVAVNASGMRYTVKARSVTGMMLCEDEGGRVDQFYDTGRYSDLLPCGLDLVRVVDESNDVWSK